MIEALRARTSPSEMDELGVAMSVIADADKRQRGLRGVITSLLPEEVVTESWVYKPAVTWSMNDRSEAQ